MRFYLRAINKFCCGLVGCGEGRLVLAGIPAVLGGVHASQ
jgi:hypothetical protein